MAPRKPPVPRKVGSTIKTPKDARKVMAKLKATVDNIKTKLDSFSHKRISKSVSFKTPKFNGDSLRKAAILNAVQSLQDASPSGAPTQPKLPSIAPQALHISSHFDIGPKLGNGKFGHVYLARHHSSSYVCALKMLSKAQITSSGEERLIRRDLEVHQRLHHPHVLRLHAWFHDEVKIYLVLEYAPNGDLYGLLEKQKNQRFREDVVARYIVQMAEALGYMHAKGIMHRDIKPENILIGLHNELKLADFGYSMHSSSGLRSTVCRTLDYISPAVMLMMLHPNRSQEFYTRAFDQWSLGVLAYELFVGKAPVDMQDPRQTKKKIAAYKGDRSVRFPGHVSQRVEGVCARVDDSRRTAEDELR